jgi:Fic family protein
LILSKWNELFAWIPIETVVYENQQGYYDALQMAGRSADSGIFIEFMLSAVHQALEALPVHTIPSYFLELACASAKARSKGLLASCIVSCYREKVTIYRTLHET